MYLCQLAYDTDCINEFKKHAQGKQVIYVQIILSGILQ